MSVSSTFKFEVFGVKTGITTTLTGQFATSVSDAWTHSDTESKLQTRTDKTTVSARSGSYTNVLLKVSQNDTQVTTHYNCPVIVTYTAELEWDHHGFGNSHKYTHTFGSTNSNAVSDLYQRAFVDGAERLDSESIDWETFVKNDDRKNLAKTLTEHIPMSQAGTTTVYTNKATVYELAGLAPIHPLSYIALTNDSDGEKNMNVGDSFNVSNVKLSGFNFLDRPYYDFHAYGSWVVVDENGKEITDGSGAITINVTGSDKPDDQPVVLTINGDYIGFTNSSSEQIEGDEDGKLYVMTTDSTGLEIEAQYNWQSQTTKGIKLETKGMVSFTQEGRYQVRVVTPDGKYHSNWKWINAESNGNDSTPRREEESIPRTEYADAETSIIIEGSYTGGVDDEPELIEGRGKLNVRGYDSTTREMALIYTWESDGTDGIDLKTDGTVSFTQTGIYRVRVKSGEYYSDWVNILVVQNRPARFTRVPTATKNTYDGEAHALLNDDAEYDGGSRVMYGLGQDAANEPKEYSSVIPEGTEAKTYYVWCKIQGDSKHEDSEAECVVSVIDAGSEPIDPYTPDDNPTNNPGSSSGGCNAGIGIAGMLLLVMLLKRR